MAPPKTGPKKRVKKAPTKKATKKVAKQTARQAGPVTSMFEPASSFVSLVRPGLGAVSAAELTTIDQSVRADFSDSLNLDEATRPGRENEHRWDYLLGHTLSGMVIALEPHSAKTDQVSTVIHKKRAALLHIRDDLRNGKRVERWLWVASGTVQFSRMDKEMRRLDQEGIQFVGAKLLKKHLP